MQEEKQDREENQRRNIVHGALKLHEDKRRPTHRRETSTGCTRVREVLYLICRTWKFSSSIFRQDCSMRVYSVNNVDGLTKTYRRLNEETFFFFLLFFKLAFLSSSSWNSLKRGNKTISYTIDPFAFRIGTLRLFLINKVPRELSLSNFKSSSNLMRFLGSCILDNRKRRDSDYSESIYLFHSMIIWARYF